MIAALPLALRLARRADLVHTTTYNAAIPAWIASALWRKRTVITVHEVFAGQWQEMPGMNRVVGFAYRAFEWLVLRLPFSRYVTPSDFTRGRVIGTGAAPPARVTTVPNPVDYDFWSPERHEARPLRQQLGLRAETFVYLYFGRAGVSKGVEFLVDAAARVRAIVPDSRLVMILSRDPSRQYRRIVDRIASRGVDDHVVLIDSVPRAELPSYLLAADCVVVPSLSEGFGYSAVEAATLGCRVIATRGHSVEELLGGIATFVPARDAESLAAAIIEASTSRPAAPPPLLPRLFTNDRHAELILEVYRGTGVEA